MGKDWSSVLHRIVGISVALTWEKSFDEMHSSKDIHESSLEHGVLFTRCRSISSYKIIHILISLVCEQMLFDMAAEDSRELCELHQIRGDPTIKYGNPITDPLLHLYEG